MKKISIMLGHSAYDGDDFAQSLLKEGIASFCYNACSYRRNVKNTDQLVSFDFNIGHMNTYEALCDMNRLPALSEQLLEQMRPYESMAIKLGQRRNHFPVVDYEREKMRYLRSLRYWNHEFDKYKIDMVFFDMTPHFQYNYIIYCLARIRKIPVLTACYTVMSKNVRAFGTDMQTVGNNIYEYYKNTVSKMDVKDCVLTGEYEKYFEKYQYGGANVKAQRKKENYFRKTYESSKKFFYSNYFGVSGALYRPKMRVRMFLTGIKRHRDKEWRMYNNNFQALLEDYDLMRFYMKHKFIYQKEYNKMAIEPDMKKKYIYYALQYNPEDNTLPKTGVFAEQYLSVQLIARAARKKGIYVYVKEHFVQPFRDRVFYDELMRIPNVKLVKTSVSSMDLTEHSIAVATQTGSEILEGALLGKPALITSSGNYWKGIPNAFEVHSEKQGIEALEKILNGVVFNSDDIRKYFYAIQRQTLTMYDADINDTDANAEYAQLIAKKTVLIKKYLLNGNDLVKTLEKMTEKL